MIKISEVEKIAELSRIRLTDNEKVQFRKEIDSILGYISQIKEVSISDDIQNRANEEVRNILRPDENPDESGIYTDSILNNAPKREGDYIKVKKIL